MILSPETLDLKWIGSIVLFDTPGWFPWLIKHGDVWQHTPGEYNHSGIYLGGGKVLSQERTLRILPLSYWSRSRIKLWKDPRWGNKVANSAKDYFGSLGWWHRYVFSYDILGVIGCANLGHAIGVPSLNFPWIWYCSEFTQYIAGEVDLRLTIKSKPTPSDQDCLFKTFDGMESLVVQMKGGVLWQRTKQLVDTYRAQITCPKCPK